MCSVSISSIAKRSVPFTKLPAATTYPHLTISRCRSRDSTSYGSSARILRRNSVRAARSESVVKTPSMASSSEPSFQNFSFSVQRFGAVSFMSLSIRFDTCIIPFSPLKIKGFLRFRPIQATLKTTPEATTEIISNPPRKLPRQTTYYNKQAGRWRGRNQVRLRPSNLPPHLYKCGGSAQAPFFTGGFTPAFARCCFCIARHSQRSACRLPHGSSAPARGGYFSLLVFTSPMTSAYDCYCINQAVSISFDPFKLFGLLNFESHPICVPFFIHLQKSLRRSTFTIIP